jgi:hypothetical protein
MKKTLFLIFSAAIFIFSIICICSAPILNKVNISYFNPSSWGYLNCKILSDNYKATKEITSDKNTLKPLKNSLNKCNRAKAVYGLEHASLIIDVILAFLCLILGLLHYFDVGKPFEKVTGIIGLATGVIQFILTLVYVCYSGYIFTNYGPQIALKADSKGIYASKAGDKFKCNFYDKDDKYAIYANFNDLGKKIYNYDKDIYNSDLTCRYEVSYYVSLCNSGEGVFSYSSPCENLYVPRYDTVENKYLYDRWVTTLIFSCFIIACDIGLAIFGFLLFKSDGSGL